MSEALNVSKYIMANNMLTPKQLQKILYFAYSIYLRKYNSDFEHIEDRLFEQNSFQAWKHGPVIPDVYHYFKRLAYANETINGELNLDYNLLENKKKNFVDKVVALYSLYSGYELEMMTHMEAPWQEASCKGMNSIITDESIMNYYMKEYPLTADGRVIAHVPKK